MDRRKKTQSGTRRRRVLRDDGSKASSRSTRSKATKKICELYEPDAVTSLQPRLTEFIPRRKRSLSACFTAGLLMIIVLQGLYLVRLNHLADLPASTTTPLHLMGAGTLSAWCASLLLALAGLVSMVIFSVRRHRVDDYRGRFGMWLTVGVACLLASADASTGIHTTFNATMVHMTGYKPFGWLGSWWAMIGGVIGIYLLVRVFVDAWRSRGSVTGLFFMFASYATATMFFYRKWRLGTDQKDMMAHTSMLLLGHVLLVFSLLTYARYVCREAAGELGKKRKRKTKSKKKSAVGEKTGWFSKFRRSKKKTATKTKTATSKTAAEAEDYDEDELERLTDPQSSQSSESNQSEYDTDYDEDYDEVDEDDAEDEGRPLGKKARRRLKKQQRRAA